MEFQPKSLVGKSVEYATQVATSQGFKVAMGTEDGKAYIMTRDYRRDRIILDVVDGSIVRARIG